MTAARRRAGHTVVLLLVALVTLHPVHAQEAWTADDTLAALEGAPWMVTCIVTLETGHTYDPYSLGAAGEEGVAQLLPAWNGGGQWEEFFYGDWTSVPPAQRSTWDPYQSVFFLEQYGAAHGYGAWSTARYC